MTCEQCGKQTLGGGICVRCDKANWQKSLVCRCCGWKGTAETLTRDLYCAVCDYLSSDPIHYQPGIPPPTKPKPEEFRYTPLVVLTTTFVCRKCGKTFKSSAMRPHGCPSCVKADRENRKARESSAFVEFDRMWRQRSTSAVFHVEDTPLGCEYAADHVFGTIVTDDTMTAFVRRCYEHR